MIFFDIDGTLLDHTLAERQGALDFYHRFADEFIYSESQFVKKWNDLSTKHFQLFLDNKLTFQQQRQMRMKQLFKHKQLTDSDADAMFAVYVSLYKNNWVIYKDVISCLESFKKQGVSLGIISNGDFSQQKEKLDNIGVLDYFSVIITSSQVGEAKPSLNIFTEAASQANFRVEDCYYIGDNLNVDAIAACHAGMQGIWINRLNGNKSSQIKTISSLIELDEII
ncbi:HAD family hydrolase [Aquibacillus rhizosphaerae]|uniref:HAD family hydrolase n=1 Tax=Aquibacillus rhizosphaerae TaxID=3051431 RepID=A0ABT7L6S9_9BACI|nr:HAD family hydrolase [Aquibacillus sp. LR5S19]MDL4841574.1 HAD family hydrolase [Aquibacillus sp. LR5S19]